MKNREYYESLIAELPQFISWINPDGNFRDSINELPKFNSELSVEDKLFATIAAYNKIEIAISYKTIKKQVGIDRKYAKAIIDKGRQSGLISWSTTFDEDTMLITGKGLVFN